MNALLSRICSATSLALLSACTLIPDYERPQAPVSGQWPSGPAYDQVASDAPAGMAPVALSWREFFKDQRLQKLIEIGLAENRDYRIAMLNVEQAQAQHRIQRSELLPNLSVTGREIHQRFSLNNAVAGGQGAGGVMPVNGQSGSFATLTAGITSYELDFFGRLRSLNEQAFEAYLASEENRRSAAITLISQIATQYLALLQYQEQYKLVAETLTAVEWTHELLKQSFSLGAISALDVTSADVQVQTARVNLTRYQQRVAQAENALTLLIGAPLPEDLPTGLPLAGQNLLSDLAAGVPSDLLENRPDIRAAEHQLLSANANIGAARAAFFPRLTLTGQAGYASGDLHGLFAGPGESWSYSPQISIPIFNFGNLQGNLDVSKVRTEIAVATYEKAIQTAFREVADSLTARKLLADQQHVQQQLVDAQRKRFTLAEARHGQGLDSYLTVLTAQQDLYIAQENFLTLTFEKLSNQVLLYKTLGGGWEEPAAEEHRA